MGTTCKKPTRANTEAAQTFVRDVLIPVHQALHSLRKDPSLIAAENDRLALNPGSVISGYEFDSKFKNVKVSLSTVRLQRTYGRPAERIWRTLFIRLYPGGRSPATNQAYDSGWVLNPQVDLPFVIAKLKHKYGMTPQQLLSVLDKFDPKVCSATEYETRADYLGFQRVIGGRKKIVTADERRKLVADAKPARRKAAEHNARLVEAMRDQQSLSPTMPEPDG